MDQQQEAALEVGRSIQRRRERLHMDKSELAELAGVHRTTIATVEEGNPTRKSTVKAITDALDKFEEEVSGPYDEVGPTEPGRFVRR